MRIFRQSPENMLFAAAAAFGLAISILYFVPWWPELPGEDLEHSWQIGMNYAAYQNMLFGSDIIFTFGPFSSAYTRNYYPGLFAQTLGITCLMTIFSTLALLRLSPRNILGGAMSIIWGVVVSIISIFYLKDAIFLILPFLVALLIHRDLTNRTVTPLTMFGVVILAYISLVKGTFAISSCATLAAVFLINSPYKLRILPITAFLISLIMFWKLSGQPFVGLTHHISSTVPIVADYTDAMSATGPIWPILIYLFASTLGMLISLKFRSIPLSIALFFLLFFTFKAAYVRQDIHEIIAPGVLLLLATLFLSIWPKPSSLALFFTAILLGCTSYNYQINTPTATIFNEWKSIPLRSTNAILEIISQHQQFETRFSNRMSELSSQNKLPEFKGTVDVYSFHQAAILASKAQWTPRPVIQSYAAYNETLARINADHLSASDRPDNLIFNIEPIDGRYSAMDDGLSWPEIWSHYNLSSRSFLGLHFIPKNTSKPFVFSKTQDIKSTLGKKIPINTSPGLTWAKITVQKNITGKLLNLAFRSPMLFIEIETDDGVTKKYRYLPQVGKAGFLLSPRVDTTQDYEDLTLAIESNASIHKTTKFITIYQEDSWVNAYNPDINLSIAELKFLEPK